MKVLVPTDFSASSKAGLRFAIRWALQQQLDLVFLHVANISRPTRTSDEFYLKYYNDEIAATQKKLEAFVARTYSTMKTKPGKHSCVLIEGALADAAIIDYCKKHPAIEFIAISTRGAGKFRRIFGTNTGNLILNSPVPVIAVPEHYKAKPITNILYASDFSLYREESKLVLQFARRLKASVEVLHFTLLEDALRNKELVADSLTTGYKYGLKVHLEKTDIERSLLDNLQKQIAAIRPSLVIMFSDRNRSLYQKIFLSSKAKELSFETKVPLLVFDKKAALSR